MTRSNRSSTAGLQVARSAATNRVRSATPASDAARSPRSTAVRDRSTPVTVQPCSASQTTSPPSPHPRSSARPPAGSPTTTSASTAFTRPDQMPSRSAYRASHQSRAVPPPPPPEHRPVRHGGVRRRGRRRRARASTQCTARRRTAASILAGPATRSVASTRRTGGTRSPAPRLPSVVPSVAHRTHGRRRSVQSARSGCPVSVARRTGAYRRRHDEIVRRPRHAGAARVDAAAHATAVPHHPDAPDGAGRQAVVMQGARHVDVPGRRAGRTGPRHHLPAPPPRRTPRLGGTGGSPGALAGRPRVGPQIRSRRGDRT